MIPKVEGASDMSTTPTACSPSWRRKRGLQRPLLIVRWCSRRTSGVARSLEEIARRQPAHPGHELRPRRPRRVAADEDDARGRRSSRLWHDAPNPIPMIRTPLGPATSRTRRWRCFDRAHGRRLHRCRRAALVRALRRHPTAREPKPSFAPPSCSAASSAWSLHPAQIAIAKLRLLARPRRGRVRQKGDRGDPRRPRRAHDRRQDGANATWKQCKVMVNLAELLARKDPELAKAYGL